MAGRHARSIDRNIGDCARGIITNNSLSRRIKELRIKRGLTQTQLARLLKTKQAAISHLENDYRNFTLSTLRDLATALGATLEVNFVEDSATKRKKN